MDRKGFIGSTDANTIMGTTDYNDWHGLWLIKTGREEPEDLSGALPVQLGIHTEPFNLEWFSTQMRLPVSDSQSHYIQSIQGVRCETHIDGATSAGIIECKHTNAFTSMDEQLAKYMPQLQFNMHLTRTKLCHLSVIFGNMKWECVSVSYDKAYFDTMMHQIKIFWDYVSTDTEPVGTAPTPQDIDAIPIDDMVRRDASTDNQFISLAHEYIDNQASVKIFDAAKKGLKASVKPTEREVYTDLLSIKRSKNGALRFHLPKE